MNEDLLHILEHPNAELLATGFEFTEGPVWNPTDDSVYFVDVRRHQQLRWNRRTGTEIVRENTGGGNGTTFDNCGRMLMCEGRNGRISRKDSTGIWTTIAESTPELKINAPNDIVCRSDGTIYFTDPIGRQFPSETGGREESERMTDDSRIKLIDKSGKVVIATGALEFCNGLAFSRDEKILYTSISFRDERCDIEKRSGEKCPHQRILAFDVSSDGSLSNERVFAVLASNEGSIPDGMKLDVEGRIYCTGPGGCWVFESDGSLTGIIRTRELGSNLAFGGSDYRDLYITARTSLYRIRTKTEGIA